MPNKPSNTGTSISPNGTGTSISPNGTGTSIAPNGTGTSVAPNGTGTGIAPNGTGTGLAPNNQPRTGIGNTNMIPEYPEYTMNGVRYVVCAAESAKTLAKKSGEAKIFVVENGGRKFVIKLYIPRHQPNYAVLGEVKKATGGFLISLRDFGKWDDPHQPGFSLAYEIMDYAPYGSLADVTLKGNEEKFKEVAWRMAFCIKQCHEHGILHRDIKPENFLYTDAQHKQFVITDFGIARQCVGKNRVKVDTSKSSYFASPEACISSKTNESSVGLATDWYSMGMTLLAMWIGVDKFYSLFPYDRIEDELDHLKISNKVIKELDDMLDMSDYSKSLLKALLEVDSEQRANFDAVKRWYQGETLASSTAPVRIADEAGTFRVVFDETRNKVANSREELAKLMLEDMEFSKMFLYRGMAKGALQQKFPRLAAEIDDITQKIYPGRDEQEVGVFAACLILDQKMPFIGLKGNRCSTATEISTEVWLNKDRYITELKKKTSRLWAYVKIRGGQLSDLAEKFQPMVSRSSVHGVYALCHTLDPSMPFFTLKGKSIKKPVDIAAELWANRNEYAQQLGNSDHSLWTYLSSLGPNAKSLAVKYPSLINSNGANSIYALCLALDNDMPYYGLKGNKCVTEKDVANEIWDNFSSYCDSLKNPTHMLWQYVRTWNDSWRRLADSYPDLIKKKSDVYTFDFLYHLDNEKPFTMQHVENGGWYSFHSFDEMVKMTRAKGISELSLEVISRPHFTTWLLVSKNEVDRKRGALLQSLIQQNQSSAANLGWFFIYSLDPQLSLYLQPDSKEYDYVMTPEQVGSAVNAALNGSSWSQDLLSQLTSLNDFKASRLYQFMMARKMQKHADGISRIVDINSNISAHRSAPYDSSIATWKVVQYLGHTPQYRCSGSNKIMSTLSEVKAMSQSERNSEINRGLASFLTLFFHEKANASFSFKLLTDYYDFLDQYCSAYRGLQNSASARKQVYAAIKDRDKAWRSLSTSRKVALWVCMPLMIIMVAALVIISLGDGYDTIKLAFESIGKTLAPILGVICGVCGLASGNIIAAVIIGFLAYWLLGLLFGLLSIIAPFLIALLMLGGAIWMLIIIFNNTKDKYIPDQQKYDQLVDSAKTYVVCEAFGTTQRTFGSANPNPTDTFNQSRDLALSNKSSANTAAIGMVVMTILSLGIFLLIYNSINNIKEEELATEYSWVANTSEIRGEYGGLFHERDASFTLDYNTDSNGYTYKAEIDIQYSTPLHQVAYGEYEKGNLTLYVVDDSGNINKSITYTGPMVSNGDVVTYSGDYTNNVKGTNHTFEFNKTLIDD